MSGVSMPNSEKTARKRIKMRRGRISWSKWLLIILWLVIAVMLFIAWEPDIWPERIGERPSWFSWGRSAPVAVAKVDIEAFTVLDANEHIGIEPEASQEERDSIQNRLSGRITISSILKGKTIEPSAVGPPLDTSYEIITVPFAPGYVPVSRGMVIDIVLVPVDEAREVGLGSPGALQVVLGDEGLSSERIEDVIVLSVAKAGEDGSYLVVLGVPEGHDPIIERHLGRSQAHPIHTPVEG